MQNCKKITDKDLIMATFPYKSKKRRRKKKNQYLAHMTKTLVLPLNNMLRKVYKNFQRSINLQIFGAL